MERRRTGKKTFTNKKFAYKSFRSTLDQNEKIPFRKKALAIKSLQKGSQEANVKVRVIYFTNVLTHLKSHQ